VTTAEAVARAVALLAASYPTWKPTEDTIEAWLLTMGDLDPGQILKAAAHHIRTSKFPPTVAEIRCHAQNREDVPTAYEAWENMRRKWLSRSAEPWCHDAARRATEQMGGFEEMSATWMLDDLVANRARWIAAYETNLAAGAARHEGQRAREIVSGNGGPELVDFQGMLGEMPRTAG